MSYEKQTWANGDVITATGLNHMEDGIADGGGGGYFVHATVSDNEVTVEENVNDIVNAIKSAQNVADGENTWYYENRVYVINAN